MTWQQWALADLAKAKAAVARIRAAGDTLLTERQGIATVRSEQQLASSPDPTRLRELDEREQELRSQTATTIANERQAADAALERAIAHVHSGELNVSDAAADSAWQARALPMLEGGRSVDEVIRHGAQFRDAALLAGLHQNLAAWHAAHGGGDDGAIRSALLMIERAQEQNGLVDDRIVELRAARRDVEATRLEVNDAWRYGLVATTPGALRRMTKYRLEQAHREGDAERVRQGEEAVRA